jgi:hypothetical protein
MLLSTFNILKLILGERTRELVFHFAHANAQPMPPYYDTYFDGHVQFNASFYGVSIPRDLLDSRVATADDDTHRLLDQPDQLAHGDGAYPELFCGRRTLSPESVPMAHCPGWRP